MRLTIMLRHHSRRLTLLITLLVASCVTSAPSTGPVPVIAPSEAGRSWSSYVAVGSKGGVATAHPLASKAANEVLKAGGNAVDALIAASFVISVVRPQSTGIGGGGFLVLHEAKDRQTLAYDFRERAPLAARREMFVDANGEPKSFTYQGRTMPSASMNGHLAVATPGLVAGLDEIHAKHGTKPWKELVQPAIEIAEQGFPVYPQLAEAIVVRGEVLKAFEDSRALFLHRNGRGLVVGDVLIQKDLAATLREIAAKRKAGFYAGKVARGIMAEMQRGRGIVTKQDLDEYSVKLRPVVEGTFNGYRVAAMPPPSSGGIHILQMLTMLEPYPLAGWGRFDAKTQHVIAEVMRRAFADRAEYLGDPDFVKVPVSKLLARSYLRTRSKSIQPAKATPSAEVKAGLGPYQESGSTTHISIVDQWGNGAASTQTINYLFGSGVVAKGTGVVLNDEMDDFSIKPGVPNVFGLVGSEANAVAARKTMLSSMSPTLVFDAKGALHMVVGSPGGPKIINATFQTILNKLAFDMPLDQAVHASRIHHQWLPDRLSHEANTLSNDVKAQLQTMGHTLHATEQIGDVQAIARTPDGWMAVSDTRSEGAPAAY